VWLEILGFGFHNQRMTDSTAPTMDDGILLNAGDPKTRLSCVVVYSKSELSPTSHPYHPPTLLASKE
jgi:hypothetical protein